MPWHCRVDLAARPSQLSAHVDLVCDLMPRWARSEAVAIALGEALANAVVHGALGHGPRPSEPEALDRFLRRLEDDEARGAELRVGVEVVIEASALSVVVSDPGRGFDPTTASWAPGRGLWLLRELADECTWNGSGNEVTLRWKRKP